MTEDSDSWPQWKKGIATRIPTRCKLLDLGLLVLRCGVGLCLVIVHGWSKLVGAVAFCRGRNWELVELVRGLGFPAPGFFAVCAALTESVGAVLVTCGLCTRLAAATITFNMLVAAYADLEHGTSIESAYLYGLPFFALILAGPGTLSLDFLREQIPRKRPPYEPLSAGPTNPK